MLSQWTAYISAFFFFIFFTLNPLLAEKEKPKKVLVFDSGGVITITDKNELVRLVAQSLQILPSDAAEALGQQKIAMKQGLDETDFWTQFAASKGIKLPPDWTSRLDEAKKNSLKNIPGMVELVKDLQKRGYKTALLANIRQNQALIKKDLAHYELFDPILFSYKIGVAKPNREAFEILLKELKVQPEAVIFIDDKEENIAGAKAVGIDAILFHNCKELVQELKKRGIDLTAAN